MSYDLTKHYTIGMLVFKEDDSSGPYTGTKYAHINTRLVRIEGDFIYNFNTVDPDHFKTQYFDGLESRCQIDDKRTPEPITFSYGWEIFYRQEHFIKQKDAEKMFRTLDRVNEKMRQLKESSLQGDDYFADFVLRFAVACGVNTFVFRSDDSVTSSYKEMLFNYVSAFSHAGYLLRSMEQNLYEMMSG